LHRCSTSTAKNEKRPSRRMRVPPIRAPLPLRAADIAAQNPCEKPAIGLSARRRSLRCDTGHLRIFKSKRRANSTVPRQSIAMKQLLDATQAGAAG